MHVEQYVLAMCVYVYIYMCVCVYVQQVCISAYIYKIRILFDFHIIVSTLSPSPALKLFFVNCLELFSLSKSNQKYELLCLNLNITLLYFLLGIKHQVTYLLYFFSFFVCLFVSHFQRDKNRKKVLQFLNSTM